MRSIILTLIILGLIVFIPGSLLSQTITLNSTFISDDEIFPFGSTGTVYGLRINGDVELPSDSSFVRINENIYDPYTRCLDYNVNPSSIPLYKPIVSHKNYNRRIPYEMNELDHHPVSYEVPKQKTTNEESDDLYNEPVHTPQKLKIEPIFSYNTHDDIMDSFLKIFPNPAKDYFTAETKITYDFTEGLIRISTLENKIVDNISLNRKRNQLIIPVSIYTSGTYLVQLIIDGEIITTKKLIITN